MSKQPREFDAVLGGNNPPPVTGVVLGGIEGVKRRLQSEIVDVRVKALWDALNYQEAGLNLVIQALEDSSKQVKNFASRLLKDLGGEKGKEALLEFEPNLYFTKIDNWEAETYNYEIGVKNPENKAYIVNFKQLKLLLQDNRVNDIEALICHPEDYSYKYVEKNEYYDFVQVLFENRENLKKLRVLFIGDKSIHEYRKSYLQIGYIHFLLKAFPNLEVLHIRGNCRDLNCNFLEHKKLKTLIIETANLSQMALKMICELSLPSLEYFELWMGKAYEHGLNNLIYNLQPILFSESFPNLSYLGIRSSEYANEIADAIAESLLTAEYPIVYNLLILDLSMGNLTDKGLETLLNIPVIRNLHILDISKNSISEEFIEEIEQLSPPNCLLITDSQEPIVDRRISKSRYFALHE